MLFIAILAILLGFSFAELNEKSDTARRSFDSRVILHAESSYSGDYLREYKRMIGSLLSPSQLTNLIKREMIRSASERSTASQLYGRFHHDTPECSNRMTANFVTIKVLQDEESNYVMLKEEKRTKKLYVEKSTRSQSSFYSETEFYSRMDTANPLFPTFVCQMRTEGREGRFSVVTEFIRGRDSHLLADVATKDQLKDMVKQLFEAVVDLHRMGYIHGDIKPGNVLVTDDFKVKLIDFGMTKRVGQAKKYRGSPYTRAPELHDMCPGQVDLGIDWWAFGSTVAIWYYYHYNSQNLKSHRALKEAADYFQIASSYDFTPLKWKGGRFQAGTFPPMFEDNVREFLSLFLTIDPELRTFDTIRLQNIIRNHEYFTN